jgi:anion transporter
MAWAFALTVPVGLWLAPLSIETRAQHALAIGAFMILAWMTHILDHAITGLIGCYLFWVLRVADFDIAFRGFSNTTPWFLFGAILFGAMATKSGLAPRLAYRVMLDVGHSYPRLMLGLIISDFLLTAIVPSGLARVVIMAAIAQGLMAALGVGVGSNISRGMFIILTYTASIFDKVVIAGAASITACGVMEKVGHVQVSWSRWAIAFLPCDLILIFLMWRLALWLYPPETTELPGGSAYLAEEIRKMGPWTALEKRSALLLGLGVVAWATDFLHHVPAPMIGLGVGLLAVLPGVGVLTIEDVKRVNLLPIFFVASAIGLGEVLTATRALDVLTNVLFGWMTLVGHDTVSMAIGLYSSVFVLHGFLGDEVSLLATTVPPLMKFAEVHSLDPLMAGMIWVFGSGAKIFVYQSAVLVVGYSYGCFSPRDLFRVGAIVSVLQVLILLLLVLFYWPLIGIGPLIGIAS